MNGSENTVHKDGDIVKVSELLEKLERMPIDTEIVVVGYFGSIGILNTVYYQDGTTVLDTTAW